MYIINNLKHIFFKIPVRPYTIKPILQFSLAKPIKIKWCSKLDRVITPCYDVFTIMSLFHWIFTKGYCKKPGCCYWDNFQFRRRNKMKYIWEEFKIYIVHVWFLFQLEVSSNFSKTNVNLTYESDYRKFLKI